MVKALLVLILAESALENVPKEIANHPAVKKHARRRGKKPHQTILDRSYHHRAMLNLPNSEKRGRPDIVHFSLLSALGTPLAKEKQLEIYVHTIADYVIYVNPEVRLPRNYLRFIGLMEQLFIHGKVPPKSQQSLLKVEKKTLKELMEEINPEYTMIFTRKGKMQLLKKAIGKLADKAKAAAIVGGFPHGSFSENTLKLADEAVCIDPETLEAWTVTARIIYEYEILIGIPEKRIGKGVLNE
ncbi:16S rRNA methyltransferase [Candidatus Bathyarchaeota archaeon]|nr:MAG: 16S rRNA methyltransferase [Candidatus Bathyarchaeota archaeon]